ncbi:galactose mutarotase [Ornithobacterium rhinotracheale]|uniref:aldose epimerase family protein n=1 Tax=Ornithobacterium rhinotracheale TaxID=28251 RepID=UPI00129C4939|nr:aldose epimerase family protein [Ornithobacterium rhinotracheale]MRI62633.1 galactose mutarotase [Ornithobacterium rhinotracheale]
MKITKNTAGKVNGQEVTSYLLENDNQMQVTILSFGGIIQSIKVPVNGKMVECVLGFDKVEDYLSDEYREDYPYFGALIGRHAGRICKGHFVLEDKDLQLSVNNNGNQLHGGVQGFDSKHWTVKDTFENADNCGIVLTLHSPDGDEGFPGNLDAEVTYTLNNENELSINYKAKSDKTTICNLTNHTYFNLSLNKGETVLNHHAQVPSDKYVPIVDCIPTGEILPVDGTDFDLREGKKVFENLDNSFIRKVGSDDVAAELKNEDGSIGVQVKTTHPVVHLYAGYYILPFKNESVKKSGKNAGIAIETQGFADSLNHENFEPTTLKAGENYEHTTKFKFNF